MGCTDSRTLIPDEERAIVISEHHFGFKEWSSQNIDYKVRKYSANRVIRANQLENIMQSLRLTPMNQSKAIERFYTSYDLNQTQELDFDKFAVTGIILGCDPPGLKAKLLFEIFDVRSEGKLPKEQIKYLIDVIVSVSLDHIPLLVNNDRNPTASEESVGKFIRRISKFRSNLITLMENKFAKSEVVKIKEFAEKFETEEDEVFINDSSLRMICYKEYQNYRKARKLKANKGLSVPQIDFTTPGSTPGNTPGYTPGNTPGYTPGNTPGNVSDSQTVQTADPEPSNSSSPQEELPNHFPKSQDSSSEEPQEGSSSVSAPKTALSEVPLEDQ